MNTHLEGILFNARAAMLVASARIEKALTRKKQHTINPSQWYVNTLCSLSDKFRALSRRNAAALLHWRAALQVSLEFGFPKPNYTRYEDQYSTWTKNYAKAIYHNSRSHKPLPFISVPCSTALGPIGTGCVQRQELWCHGEEKRQRETCHSKGR